MAERKVILAKVKPTYADPVDYSSRKEYAPLTYVRLGTKYYMSTQYVPAGVTPANTSYWAYWGDSESTSDLKPQVNALQVTVDDQAESIAQNAERLNVMQGNAPGAEYLEEDDYIEFEVHPRLSTTSSYFVEINGYDPGEDKIYRGLCAIDGGVLKGPFPIYSSEGFSAPTASMDAQTLKMRLVATMPGTYSVRII